MTLPAHRLINTKLNVQAHNRERQNENETNTTAAKDKATARVTAPFHAKVTHAQGSATGNGAPSTAAAAGVAKEANIPEEGADATREGIHSLRRPSETDTQLLSVARVTEVSQLLS